MRFERLGFQDDSGRIYEARFLGEARMDGRFIEALRALPRDERTNRFRSFQQVIDTFKQHYEGDPLEPAAMQAKDLRLAVIEALDLSEKEENGVKFYSTVKTPLDAMGFDAFVEFTDPKTRDTARVTIDVTLNDQKINEGGKADVIIGRLPDAVQNEDEYLESIDKYGGRIAQQLRARLDRRQQSYRKAA